ncbi:SpoIIE family protein phosphatase [Thiorhodococcus minor]|uniref:SpoIIE family protein phosphatase n=1 Tax=Thiorhodococcus minor TaxID=57489 RepID=A0A6M0K145_9GAMM|nr:SpoIIE family protein phosphatase [Thiorhodococcus minor]
MSVAARLSLVVSLFTSSILLAVLGLDYLRSVATLDAEIDRSARSMTRASANYLETVLMTVTRSAEALAIALETGRFDDAETRALVRRAIGRSRNVFGGGIYFHAKADQVTNGPRSDHYCHWSGNRVQCMGAAKGVDLWSRDWLRLPAEKGRAVWCEPYFDSDFGRILMVTLSVPFYRHEGEARRLEGVVTADLALDWLTQEVSSLHILETGYGMLLSPNGTFIAHPKEELLFHEDLHSIPEALGVDERSEIAAELMSGAPGVIEGASVFGSAARLYHAQVKPAGWTLVLVVPEDEIDDQVSSLTLTTASVGIAGLILMLLAIVMTARAITRPLCTLVAATREVAIGHFDTQIPDQSRGDEVGLLASAFATMTQELRDYIARLTTTTAAKERIESELRIAHDIQMSILPKLFPPLPDRHEIDLYALIEPAKEVGGDFYDFYAIDDDHFCLVIADVAGKGVPASLFMAVTKTLIKSTAKPGRSPGEILSLVNADLARDNDQSMFITVFCAILDLRSGELIYANAGHNPPIRLCAEGEAERLPSSNQLVLGLMEDVRYRDTEFQLRPGDRLLLYTDGVTEAMNLRDEPFGDQRLESELIQLASENARQISEGIVDSVKAFAGSAPQSDDITIMLLEYQGAEGQAERDSPPA